MYVYWLAPYPNTMALWPQWRSALVWDFWAILSYLLFSILFLYVGLLPDLATMRDRARTRAGRSSTARSRSAGAARPGTGSASRRCTRRWPRLAVPLVVSVHSIVGLDFAASLMPGWQETIFPPYFVVGAMYSGFAMVLLLALLIRWGMQLQAIITVDHFDAMAQDPPDRLDRHGAIPTRPSGSWPGTAASMRTAASSRYLFTGDYAPLYWVLLVCNCVLPQALWFRRVRRSVPAVVIFRS